MNTANPLVSIALDPTNPDQRNHGLEQVKRGHAIVFLLVTACIKPVDGGTNWKKMGFEKSERIAGIQVNP